MTMKNFLKTAVLGIVFCSVFGMNSGMAMDNKIYFSAFLNKLNKLDESASMKCRLYLNLDVGTLNKFTESYDSIKNTINNAIYHNINDEKVLNQFDTDIQFLKDNYKRYCSGTGNGDSIEFILKHAKTLREKIQNELDLNLEKILKIIKKDLENDVNYTTYPIEECMKYFDKTIIVLKINEILNIIDNTINNKIINNSDYNKLISDLKFLSDSPLGVKHKSGEGMPNSEYSYIISTINEYSERIKIEAKKYLVPEGWEVL